MIANQLKHCPQGDMPLIHVIPEYWRRLLPDWGPDKMVAILQTTFLNAFSWMKMYEFRLKFHWSLFIRVQLTALVQIMAWRLPGDKPWSEPMMVRLSTHICVTRPQWVTTRRYRWQKILVWNWHQATDNHRCRQNKTRACFDFHLKILTH